MSHPYEKAPSYTKWRKAMTGPGSAADPASRFPFRINRNDRVATAGSCFAQHIARNLASGGYNYYVTEPGHAFIRDVAAKFGYGLFSARYGNIYTSRQLLQLIQRAYGKFSPCERSWSIGGRSVVDPLRPTVQPGGFISEEALNIDRRQHLKLVREMFEGLDYFVFTLGLTEVWTSRNDGTAYPICPGVAGGIFSSEKYIFQNLSVSDVISDMTTFYGMLKGVNPSAKLILTVSPVALAATAEDSHVLCATTYSKSVLRVAAETLARAKRDIAYFPSFEIITGPQSRGAYFDQSLRDVTPQGVERVMGLFFQHATDRGATAAPAGLSAANQSAESARAEQEEMSAALKNFVHAECDEILLGQ